MLQLTNSNKQKAQLIKKKKKKLYKQNGFQRTKFTFKVFVVALKIQKTILLISFGPRSKGLGSAKSLPRTLLLHNFAACSFLSNMLIGITQKPIFFCAW